MEALSFKLTTYLLLYFNYAIDSRFVLGCEFGEGDFENTILNFCTDFLFIHIVGELECLLEFGVGKFATQIFLLLFLLVLSVLLNGDYQFLVLVKVDIEVFFVHSGSGNLNLVVFFVFNHIDSGSAEVRFYNPLVVEEIIEDTWYPILVFLLSYV